MENNSKILFLLTNYFNEEEVFSFISEQLKPKKNKFIDIIITNNGSKNSSILENKITAFQNVTLLKSAFNLGYFGAANIGLTHYLNQQKEYPKAIIICNTDIKLAPDFFSVLQNKLSSENFDILGPSIYSSFSKQFQNPYITSRIKKNKLLFLKFTSSNPLFYKAFTIYHVLKSKTIGSKNKITENSNPYAIHGSFMIFNKTFFLNGGTINYPSLLFGEEIFIAEQAQKLKMITLFDPNLKLEHAEHATTKIFKSNENINYLHQSYCYLLKTFF
ncbi:MAG TPA: glycosyltransferase [Bacteroidia bacterium]|nr:glycosyltransferase [Bacteroidia bacterium]